MTGFDPKAIDLAFGPDAVPNLRRENARRLTQNNGDHPAWLRGLIARHGQPVTYQPDPLQLGDCWYQTWAWVGFGLQIEQGPSTWKVSAHRAGVRAKLAGLRAYPTEAQIADVIALAGLDDAPERATAGPIVPTPLPGPIDDHVDRVRGPIRTADQPATVRRGRQS